ncbi:MAG TPA: peptide chain release factor-like protein [Planctomycetota bacterium]|nr:peptide chain release factor-like protein [Planctomycetota bacterium]
MKFPADAPVTAAKLDELRARIARLRIDLSAIDEQAVKGSGPGGQKVNKTQSGVLLRYIFHAAGNGALVVKWTRERQRSLNRFLALRELVDEIELRVSPETSERLKEQSRIRKQKDRARRRTRAS